MERLQKIISNSGYCSRRKAEALIEEGRVTVNGEKAVIGQKASPSDRIIIDRTILRTAPKHIYIALHKPKGYVSTTSRIHDQKTVMDLLPSDMQHIKPAGRLDMNSEGLIVLSSDGEFINRLTHPRFPHKKVYKVTVKGHPKEEDLKRLTSGKMQIDGYTLNPMPYYVINSTDDYTKLEITLSEGRKRQIREVFKQLGHPVVYLRRTEIGPIKLGELKRGEFHHIYDKIVEEILRN